MQRNPRTPAAISGTTGLSAFDSTLFECSPDCVKLLDLDGRLLAMNRNGQCIMEISDFGSVANSPWELLWPEQSRHAVRMSLDAARRGETGRFSAFCPTAAGTPKWWDVTVIPMPAVDGEAERLLSVSRDVTAEHRAREELRFRQAQFELLLESSAEGIYGMAPDNSCTFINGAGAAILGYEPDELIGRRLHHLIHHHRADGSIYLEQECRLFTAVADGVPVRIEDEVFWRKDGTPVAVSYSVAPMKHEGRHAGAVVTFTDVTRRKQSERALQESEERFRSMADAIPQIVWSINAEGRAVFFNRQWTSYTGTSINPDDPADVSAQFVHPDDHQPTMQAWQKAWEEKATFTMEHRIRSASGEYRWFLVRAEPFLDAATGKLLQWFGTSTDIHDRKQAEVALFDSRERLQKIISQAATGVVEADASGRIVLANEKYSQMLGYSEDELIGTSLIDVTAPDSVAQTLDVLRQLVDGGEGFTIDKQYQRKDGSLLWATSSVTALHDADRRFRGLVGIVIDITERKRVEEALKQADRRKDEFLAMLAHELRNPLAPIGAAAELLQLAGLNEARVRQTSQIIARQVKHMTGLVDDLLDVSRVTRGLVELDNVPLDVSHVITDAVEQVMPLIRSRRHHLGLQMTPEAPLVMGDRKRLVQVVANLLNNAAKYMHEGGHIVLRTEVQDDQVFIEVRDEGIGMTPELVSRAFDLFAQAERSSDRSSGGLGLGLALVRSLVELHRGTVTCESAGLGRGSRFTVRLPRLSAGDTKDDQAEYADSPMREEAGSLRMMVVDDNVDAAEMLAMLLEASGHEVLVEHGSRKALERAREVAPQVCLLDIGLPEIDGNELARRLRAQPETANSVLIAVTGYGQESDREQILAAGFDHHLVKPVDTRELASLLAEVSRE
jgi:PAS domain S-box-containing protein